MENKCAKLVSRLLRKSSKIDDLMYLYQNRITVKEELAQLNDMFKMLVDIHEEFKQSILAISGLTTLIKKCSPSNTKCITG